MHSRMVMSGAVCQIQRPSQPDLPAIAYEREAGAASRPIPRGYRRRAPEQTALHVVVREHIEILLDEGSRRSDAGTGYLRFIEHEFRRYLDCGLLSRGLARLRCPSCGFEQLVAFSCKGRRCPSCWARRTADIAAHLVDRGLPEASYRQWVLTVPWQLRFLLAVDSECLADRLRAFLRTRFAWQRLRGRRVGVADGQTGSVTFLQRFGGILNLHPHCHCLLPDGLFVPPTAGRLLVAPLPPPTDKDMTHVTTRLSARLGAIARRRIELAAEQAQGRDDDQALVHGSAAEAVRVPIAPARDRNDDHCPDERRTCARLPRTFAYPSCTTMIQGGHVHVSPPTEHPSR